MFSTAGVPTTAWNYKALIHCYEQLKQAEVSRGCITNQDLSQSFLGLGENERHRHASAVLESTLQPVLDDKTMSLSFKIVGNVSNALEYVDNLINHLKTRSQSGQALRQIELLQQESKMEAVRTTALSPPVLPPSFPPPGLLVSRMPTSINQPLPTNLYQPTSINHPPTPINQPFVLSKFEASEPICKFLAMLRKNGMDILFPISTQDYVLASIFVAVREPDSTPLAHRELIDIVIYCKNFSTLRDNESISKTKVRGVLALLKHSEILLAQTVGEGLPVQLSLSHSIRSFEDLRSKLDVFLLAFSTEFSLGIPQDMWCQLVWLDTEHNEKTVKVNLMIEDLQAVHNAYIDDLKKSSRKGAEVNVNLEIFSPGISANTTRDDWESPYVSHVPSLDDSDFPVKNELHFLGMPQSQLIVKEVPFKDFSAFKMWTSSRLWDKSSYDSKAQISSDSFATNNSALEDLIDKAVDLNMIEQAVRHLSPNTVQGELLFANKEETLITASLLRDE